MRPRLAMTLAVASALLGAALLVPAAYSEFASASSAQPLPGQAQPSMSPQSPPPPPPPTLRAAPVKVTAPLEFFSWALMDRKTGKISGSSNIAATNSTESMVKVWLVSDYLRRVDESGKQPSSTRLQQASTAIRDSDDDAAQALYAAGGYDDVIRRMIKICKLTDTKVHHGWWSMTQISAEDAVRLGNCVGDGRAAGPHWTKWVLTEMQKVRGSTAPEDQHEKSGGGRWGIIDGLPKQIVEQGVSIKNGWTQIWADGMWHVNCLAVAPDWVLAVLMRYPANKPLNYGANVCKNVAEQLVYQPSSAAAQQ